MQVCEWALNRIYTTVFNCLRTLNVASSTGSDHVISFIGSLGNKLYTTNAKEE